MQNSAKKFALLSGAAGLGLSLVPSAHAVCPVCTVAVGAGVGFARSLGVDDAVSGIWIGGLLASMVGWTENWLDKKNVRFAGRVYANLAVYVLLVLVPLWYTGLIGHPGNALPALFGMDKLLLGILTGAAAFWFGASWYADLKAKNGGRAWFPFQKVVWPVAPLALCSAFFALLLK